MSSKHDNRDRERRRGGGRSRSRSPKRVAEDWRNVKVKEEPVSDVEGGSHSHRRHGHGQRGRNEREHDRSAAPRGYGRRSRSRSRERDRHRDGRYQERVRIKEEPRSRSRSPPRPEGRYRPDRDRDNRRRDEGRQRDHRGPGAGAGPTDRNRDVKRERDWDNFFNPESDMSQSQAVVRREPGQGGEEGEGENDAENKEEKVEKDKPNFGLSGKLTEETNTFRGVVIKYSEPPEARKPIKTRWRLYPFKDGESLEVMYIHRQSAYLLGRERKIADIPIDHPSCSKQHAVLQYRLVPYEKPNGQKGRRIRPYIIDLESANGTFVNGKKIDPKRYVELFEKDVLKFGFSSREYVLLHEHSQDDEPPEEDNFDKSPSPD